MFSTALSTASILLLLVPTGSAAPMFPGATQEGIAGQTAPSEAMQAAMAKYRAKDYEGALGLFEGVTLDEPENARAWYMLGSCIHATGDYATALEIHTRAAEFPAVRADASYNAGCAHARLGNKQEAFAWLRKALDAGFSNPAQLATDADLAGLRNDPRFNALVNFGAKLTFQEDVEILLELRGETAGDRFGWIGRNAGDVDGDGINDMLLSAPYFNNGSAATGRVYVYSSATGDLVWKVDGIPGANLGIGIESIGDINADGVPDQIAGASTAYGTGAAYALSGKDGATLLEWRGETAGDGFGGAVSGAGDMNEDGIPDVIVGAANFDGSGANSGRVYVYSGKDGKEICVLDGEQAGDLFGQAVDAHADSDTKLLVIGASAAGPKANGRVVVYRVKDSQPKEAFRMEARDGDRQLGMMFVSAVGDVNGDGVVDIYGSDWASNGEGIPACGRIYIHSGKDGELLHVLAGQTPGEGFGIGSSEAGDVDGDGCDDFLVGSWQYAGGARGGGKCTLFSGKTGAIIRTYTCTTPAETFGFDTTTLGDVNADGVPDFLITNADSHVNGAQSGRVVIVAGPARPK